MDDKSGDEFDNILYIYLYHTKKKSFYRNFQKKKKSFPKIRYKLNIIYTSSVNYKINVFFNKVTNLPSMSETKPTVLRRRRRPLSLSRLRLSSSLSCFSPSHFLAVSLLRTPPAFSPRHAAHQRPPSLPRWFTASSLPFWLSPSFSFPLAHVKAATKSSFVSRPVARPRSLPPGPGHYLFRPSTVF